VNESDTEPGYETPVTFPSQSYVKVVVPAPVVNDVVRPASSYAYDFTVLPPTWLCVSLSVRH
jgi:hypothetical protein